MSVAGLTKAREAREESFRPFDVASPYRIGKVGKFDSEEGTHFTQVLDRPALRSCTEFGVDGVDVRALSNQELSDMAMR